MTQVIFSFSQTAKTLKKSPVGIDEIADSSKVAHKPSNILEVASQKNFNNWVSSWLCDLPAQQRQITTPRVTVENCKMTLSKPFYIWLRFI